MFAAQGRLKSGADDGNRTARRQRRDLPKRENLQAMPLAAPCCAQLFHVALPPCTLRVHPLNRLDILCAVNRYAAGLKEARVGALNRLAEPLGHIRVS